MPAARSVGMNTSKRSVIWAARYKAPCFVRKLLDMGRSPPAAPSACIARLRDVASGISGAGLLAAMAVAIWTPLVHGAMHSPETAGKKFYGQAGCIACHQAEGKGSDFAPMLPGHTAEQVKRYVRNPVGKMPRFGNDKLSDAELGAIATYIAALPMPEMSSKPPDSREAMEMHHWMAYRLLKDNDPAHAEHHLLHGLSLAMDDGHRRSMDNVLDLTRAKRTNQAAQRLLELMSADVKPDLPIGQMHLRLALGALEAGDVPETEHHVRHYLETASPHDRHHAQQLLPLLRKGDVISVRKRLTHLMAK
jgi:mono/diheme cytochrome c family protein